MHTTVNRPLTHTGLGSITCCPIGHDPIDFAWSLIEERGPVRLSVREAEATELSVGRYRVEAEDAIGARAEMTIDLEPIFSSATVIQGYHVTPASTGLSRDGAVEIIGLCAEGRRYMWTNGVETSGTTLQDVPCGTYAVTAVTEADNPVVVVHMCAPACVVASDLTRWDALKKK